MKFVSALENSLKKIFEEDETLSTDDLDVSSGAKIKAPETIEDLRTKADKVGRLSKIKKEQGSSLEKEIDFFEMSFKVGDSEIKADLNNETAKMVNDRFEEIIENGLDTMKESPEEKATVNIAYQFVDTDVELKISFSINKDQSIENIETNLQNFSVKDIRSLRKWWEDFKWRSLE